MTHRGTHLLYDGTVDRSVWESVEVCPGVGLLLLKAAEDGDCTVLDRRLIELPCPGSRSGSPSGGTAWIGLDESHITLHWYHEGGWVRFALDVFTCGDHANPHMVASSFLSSLPGCRAIGFHVTRFADEREGAIFPRVRVSHETPAQR